VTAAETGAHVAAARDGKRDEHARARRLEWVTIACLVPTIAVVYFAVGSSQAMKTAWVEDVLSLVPPIAFLVAVRFEAKAPSPDFPYGFHRTMAIAFLCAAMALFTVGAYLLVESLATLVRGERPTIGSVELFGRTVWHGWVMMAVLAVTSVPPVVLGRKKRVLAQRLHDKALHADAEMNRADWQTAAAGILGLLGIGLGLWWADAAAAALIALSVLRDGVTNLRQVAMDLMDMAPTAVGTDEIDPLPARLREALERMPWVAAADVRLREAGHVIMGEAYVVARAEQATLAELEAASRQLRECEPRLQELAIVPVRTLARPRSASAE
jgi:divalent metal cation (Fe/Co/Zn/Cd) transporter